MTKPTMDLETAKAVLLAAREAEEEARNAKLQRHVGKFFRFRNSYGSGEKWWLYGMVTRAEMYMGCRGVTFQRSSSEHVEIELNAGISIDSGGWEPITAAAFWREAAELRDAVGAILTPKREGHTAKGTAKRTTKRVTNSRGGT